MNNNLRDKVEEICELMERSSYQNPSDMLSKKETLDVMKYLHKTNLVPKIKGEIRDAIGFVKANPHDWGDVFNAEGINDHDSSAYKSLHKILVGLYAVNKKYPYGKLYLLCLARFHKIKNSELVK